MAEIVAVADFTPAVREPEDIAALPARRKAHPGRAELAAPRYRGQPQPPTPPETIVADLGEFPTSPN
jgi:hypothetical protein